MHINFDIDYFTMVHGTLYDLILHFVHLIRLRMHCNCSLYSLFPTAIIISMVCMQLYCITLYCSAVCDMNYNELIEEKNRNFKLSSSNVLTSLFYNMHSRRRHLAHKNLFSKTIFLKYILRFVYCEIEIVVK